MEEVKEEFVSTGMSELDNFLGGGIRKRSSVTVSGPGYALIDSMLYQIINAGTGIVVCTDQDEKDIKGYMQRMNLKNFNDEKFIDGYRYYYFEKQPKNEEYLDWILNEVKGAYEKKDKNFDFVAVSPLSPLLSMDCDIRKKLKFVYGLSDFVEDNNLVAYYEILNDAQPKEIETLIKRRADYCFRMVAKASGTDEITTHCEMAKMRGVQIAKEKRFKIMLGKLRIDTSRDIA